MILLSPKEIVAEIDRQLAWRGPGGRSMGHIVLDRDNAIVLVNWIKQAAAREAEVPLGIQVVSLDDPAQLHNTIATALGEKP